PLFLADPAPPAHYTLSLHDALPISGRILFLPACAGTRRACLHVPQARARAAAAGRGRARHRSRVELDGGRHPERRRGGTARRLRSEEHTSELQSRENLVCRLLLEKK